MPTGSPEAPPAGLAVFLRGTRSHSPVGVNPPGPEELPATMTAADMTTGEPARQPTEPKTWTFAAIALLAPCGFCWAVPNTACTDVGQHYARYLRAYRRGILNAAGMAIVSNASPCITAGTIVPDAGAQKPLTDSGSRSGEERTRDGM